MKICNYCGRKIRYRYWMNISGTKTQCDRFLCRLMSGHWLWMNCQRKIIWKDVIMIKRPTLSRKGFDR